ncbi:MAG: nucleotidyltransferase domain-containing protein [Chloroflexota bacterium]
MKRDRMSNKLPTTFFTDLVAEIDQPHYAGILLGGSYARGEATELSDVDIACIVPDNTKLEPKRFFYRHDRLVSVGVKSITGIRASLTRPEEAIWVVVGIGDCKVLLDKDGSVAALLEEVRAFTFEPLRDAAYDRAGWRLAMAAETVHKVANEIGKENDNAIAFATAKLLDELTVIMAIGRCVLIKTDSTYYQQVQEAAGPDSAWTYYHRFLTWVDTEYEDDLSIRAHGFAVLTLYRETARLLTPIMKPEHLQLVNETLDLLKKKRIL